MKVFRPSSWFFDCGLLNLLASLMLLWMFCHGDAWEPLYFVSWAV
jgi:hypothetical protein